MIRSYIIHMDSSTARRGLVDGLMARLPGAEVLPAVDGRVMDDASRTAITAMTPHDPAYPFPLKPGEIGCFLSHRKAWAAIVASGDAAGLIVEDDIAPTDGFDAALALALDHIAPNRLIRFPLRDKEEVAEVVATADGVRLFRPRVIGLTTGMQIVGREAAARLLDLTDTLDRPVDTFLQMRWLHGVEVVSLTPAPVRSAVAETGGSTIQSHTSAWAEISRGWRRMRYRSRVARLSGDKT
ncbi:glycosyltransferase family 25 protein [Pseudooceanicola onchidii]|uniref:glycosyltransferase family 25 protein n=1 Tax=Pseudooceanicola onchidii TaxID=2562279 RepID=UPI0010A9B001|nr:glycosyltransferase family 25 protein [Pseudooceanicola onchidii]